ncbi:MAG: glycoside hydrolase [Planctomycetia bacterium]|nr:glycoside hydrolase [Planctomycetia bacterium]
MKNVFYRTLFFLFAGLLISPLFSAEPESTIDFRSKIWARTKEEYSLKKDDSVLYQGKPTAKVVHKGEEDWAISFPKSIAVEPGDIFEISCMMKTEGVGDAGISAILYKGKESADWGFGRVQLFGNTDWTELKTTFVVPLGSTSIQPRITGHRVITAWFTNFQIKKAGKYQLEKERKIHSLENRFLKIRFDSRDGTFSVFDKRIGRLWEQTLAGASPILVVKSERKENEILCAFLRGQNTLEYTARIALEEDKPELTVSVDTKDKNSVLTNKVQYPFPFIPGNNDRLILPVNEGISFPVREKTVNLWYLYTYGGHGLCMGFFGNIEDKIGPAGGNGYLAIFETPDDSGVQLVYQKPRENMPELSYGFPCWDGQTKKFGYKRQIRYVFFDKGGHVALCKRYREYSKQIGLYMPFTEKIKKNPNLKEGMELLIGAANIWYFGNEPMKVLHEMKAAGMDRILWSAGGSPENLTAMNKIDGVLTSRYDIYQDLMDPARLKEVGVHPDWTQDAWPNEINWTHPDGTWRKGWGVIPKGATEADVKSGKVKRIRCAVLCDSKALPYAEKRIEKELKTKPFKARFIDTTVAAPWYECFHPDHPMNRTQSRYWKMKLLELLGARFNLVCGSETGHEASVPYCDFFEGMNSLGPYRLPHGGLTNTDYSEPTPDLVKKYQVGTDYRLPLWELVYHDCTVGYNYWYDFNNRKEDIWKKRDLLCALYGFPPMYRFTQKIWDAHKEKIAESYKIAEPVSRLTGWVEMTDHQILTEDRLVQKTVFANGVEVIANFGSTSWTAPNGDVFPAESMKICQ